MPYSEGDAVKCLSERVSCIETRGILIPGARHRIYIVEKPTTRSRNITIRISRIQLTQWCSYTSVTLNCAAASIFEFDWIHQNLERSHQDLQIHAVMGGGGSKSRLPKEDMDFLIENTNFSKSQIKQWYKGFMVIILFLFKNMISLGSFV